MGKKGRRNPIAVGRYLVNSRGMIFLIRYSTTIVAMLLVFCLGSSSAQMPREFIDLEARRERLLAFLIRQQLVVNHFSQKKFDDDLSIAAFTLYLKQLDSQKRFLLAGDVQSLEKFNRSIDDEMLSGYIEFPRVSRELLQERINKVQEIVSDIMAAGFDFSREEELETDPDKLTYCRTTNELAERWRKILKYQVLWRYLELQEERSQDPARKSSADVAARKTKSGKLDQALLKEAVDKVQRSTGQLLVRLQEVTEKDYVDRYFDAVCRAFDPHTNYLPPDENEDFEISMKGSLEGIGATLREEDGYIKVVSIVPGSPAFREGQIHAEDIILKVAEGDGEPVDVTDSRLRDAVQLIRGKKGTKVKLTIKRPEGTELVVAIIRDVVQIEETFVKSTVLEPLPGEKGRFGYLKIPTFYRDFTQEEGENSRNSTDDARRALKELAGQHVDGIVLDLRNNGGGSLVDAVQIAGLFIAQGPIVQVKNSSGNLDVLADKDPAVFFRGPVVVLVNRFSASASEILAGALQDYRRAVVLGGDRTHGKGTVQTIINLNRALPSGELDMYKPLGAMKITIQKFYRISGQSTQMQGIEPDIVLPDPLGYLKSGEQYADYALAWDSVSKADFAPWKTKTGLLEALRADSQKRLVADPRYLSLVEQARRNEDRSQKSSYPLVLNSLRNEIQELKALREESAPDGGSSSERENPASWQAKLAGDFNVAEAVHVLGDLLLVNNNRSPGRAVAGTVTVP
jgi:carboxyl-terminal processing protease